MRGARILYAVLYGMVLYLPIVLLIFFSFNDSVYIAFPFTAFTLRWYEAAMANAQLLNAFGNSVTIAAVTSITATVVGMFAAMATARHHFRGRGAMSIILFAPLALPTVVTGVSLLSIFMISGFGLSKITVVIGHVMICTPFAYGVMASCFQGLSSDYERASMDLGIPPVATFFRITLPLAMPAVVSSLLLTFTISFDEFILAFFLSSNSPTLPVFMWSQMRFPDRLPLVLALATIVIVVSSALIIISQLLRRRAAVRVGG